MKFSPSSLCCRKSWSAGVEALVLKREARDFYIILSITSTHIKYRYYELPGMLDLARAKRVRTGLNDQRSSGRHTSTSPERYSLSTSPGNSSSSLTRSSPMKSRASPMRRDLKSDKDANEHMSRLCLLLNTLNHLFTNMPVLSERMSRGLNDDDDNDGSDAEEGDHVNLWRILKDYAPDRENALNLLVFLVYWKFSGEFEMSFRDTTKDWGLSDADLENMNHSAWIDGLAQFLKSVIPGLRARLVRFLFRGLFRILTYNYVS